MKKIVKYKCQFCGKISVNKLEIEQHEIKCKDFSLVSSVAEARISALLLHYSKLGYVVDVVYHDDPERYLVSVRPGKSLL